MKIKQLASISLGHLSIDVLSSSIPLLLTFVSGRFDLSPSQIGLGVMICTFASSLTQPFFGILADRLQGRWLGAIGLFWFIFFYTLVPFAPNFPIMILLLAVGSLGSGLFHPVGVVNAADSGGQYPTTATSIFFLLGQSGLALGPIILGSVLHRVGLQGLPIVAAAMLPAAFMMVLYLRHPISSQPNKVADSTHHTNTATNTATQAVRAGAVVILALVALTVLRAATMQSYMTLLPTFFQDQGYNSEEYGYMIGIFGFAGALGTFCGGWLGDRYNRRKIIFVTMVLSVPFTYFMIGSEGIFYYTMSIISGLLLSIPHSIVLVMAQNILPKNKGMVGGAVLGIMFASGAVMAWISGIAADTFGLKIVLLILAFFPVGAGFSVFWLPKTRA